MEYNNRILIVDDNKKIHSDLEKILINRKNEDDQEIDRLENLLFSEKVYKVPEASTRYTIHHAYQGEKGVEMVKTAQEEGTPYALCFMDVRMPPGIDGIEAIKQIWKIDYSLEVVICTAYSDYSWDLIIRNLGNTDRLLFLQKPFNVVEVKQLALSLVKKWNLNHELQEYVNLLEEKVRGGDPSGEAGALSGKRPPLFSEEAIPELKKTLKNQYNLSRREVEVCLLLIKGCLYKEIASQLVISINTVGFHAHNVYKKVGAQNVAELIHKLS